MRFFRTTAALVLAVVSGFAAPLAHALEDGYPSRPTRLIVPFPAGGPTDLLARVVGERMGASLGQAIIVDNKPGANTIIGASVVAKAAPDGYTLLMAVDNTLAMNQFLYTKLSYDPVKDFEPVGKVAVSPLIVVTGNGGPKSMTELLARMRAEPAEVSYGFGTFTTQFAGEMIRRAVGKDVVGVPYKGSSAVTQALLGKDVLFTIDGITAALPYIQNGSFRALARLSDRKLPGLGDVPRIQASGLKMPDVEVWMALVAPAGTPAPVVARLNAELRKALASEDVQKRLLEVGLVADGSTPQALRAFVAAESRKWQPVIAASGLKLD